MKKAPFIHIVILTIFLVNTVGPLSYAQADEFTLPKPGVMMRLSPAFNPPMLKGIKVHPDNPFRFDFVLDQGDNVIPAKAGIQHQEQLKTEANKLIKYFLASLTIPEKDLWVNLSPYEKDRIVPESFGQTEMGRDLLAQDYILKQLTASLIYPEDEIGKKFWKRVYEEAQKKYGTTEVPINTFNKVWIVPEKAVVYENAKTASAYVVEAKLKVMLEQDYLALDKNKTMSSPNALVGDPDTNIIGSKIVKEIIIPELTKEINEGKNFVQLRQVYQSLILATWYKKKIRAGILAKIYADKNKITGLTSTNSSGDPEHIYQQYLQAFKKGAYNYIKEETDPLTKVKVPRKYFSGGVSIYNINESMMVINDQRAINFAMTSQMMQVSADLAMVNINPPKPVHSKAMAAIQLKEEDYLAPDDQQEKVFDTVDHKIIDPDIKYKQTYQMANTVFADALRAAGLQAASYRLYLLEDSTSNAFIIPYTARVYMHIGLLREIAALPQKTQKSVLAFVFSHEITHILQYRKAVEEGKKPSLEGFDIYAYIRNHIDQYTNEYAADGKALFLTNKAGYSVKYAPLLFEKWAAAKPIYLPWAKHPDLMQRVNALKKILRTSAWKSWKKEDRFGEEVLKELPEISERQRSINKVVAFGAQRQEVKISQINELINMIDEAPDYEALFFVMQHIYYYISRYFQSGGEVMRLSTFDQIRGNSLDLDNLDYKANLTPEGKRHVIEESIRRFLSKAKALRATGDNYRIFEQEVVKVFSGDATRGAHIDTWLASATNIQKLDFIEFGYPYSGFRGHQFLDEDDFVSALFGDSPYVDAGHTKRSMNNMFQLQGQVVNAIANEIRVSGNKELLEQTLKALRRFKRKMDSKSGSMEKFESQLMQAYWPYLQSKGKDLKKEIFVFMDAYQILEGCLTSIEEEGFRPAFNAMLEIYRGDPVGWEKLIDYMSQEKNKRIRNVFKKLLISKKNTKQPMVAIYKDDIKRNIHMLTVFWDMDGSKGKKNDTDFDLFVKSLGGLMEEMEIKAPKDQIQFWLTVYKSYPFNKRLYSSGSFQHELDQGLAFQYILTQILKNMPENDFNSYMQESLGPVFAELGLNGLNEMPRELRILSFLYYFTGPVILEVFFNNQGAFNLNNYFHLTILKDEDSRRVSARNGFALSTKQANIAYNLKDLDLLMVFLRRINGRMHVEFEVPLKADLVVSEQVVEETEDNWLRSSIFEKRDMLTIATWSEYLQIIGSFVEAQREVSSLPVLSNSRGVDHFRLNLFWGESVGRAAIEELMKELKELWFGKPGRKAEGNISRYSRHGHGKIIEERLNKLYANVPAEKSHDILSWFKAIELSPQDYKQWEEKILAEYSSPSVFRNYFLYAAFVYKALKPLPNFDISKAFDLGYLSQLMAGLDALKQQEIRNIIADLNKHLTFDWRVEVFNMGILSLYLASLKSVVGDKDTGKTIIRRNAAVLKSRSSHEALYMTPGGVDSQLDLLTALIDEKYLLTQLNRSDLSFQEKLGLLLKSMPKRRNSELDRFVQIILDSTALTLQELQTLLDVRGLNLNIDPKDDNHSIFYSWLLRDKLAFKTLEREYLENPELFKTINGELERIKKYFPSFSPMRDGILKALVKRRIEEPKALEAVEQSLLISLDNMDKNEVRRRIFGKDITLWLLSNTSLETRRMFLEWLLGWRRSKPPDIVDFENKYVLNLDAIRDQLLKVDDGAVYTGVREHMMREFIQLAMDGFIENDGIVEEFTSQMLQSIVPRGVSDTTYRIYQGIMDSILSSKFKDRKKQILTTLAMEWMDIQLAGKQLSTEEVEARMIGAFFQANGFMGVKLAQVLSSSSAFQMSDAVRKKLSTLKSDAKPIEKGVAIKILDEVLPGGFSAHFKRLIGEPVGSASLKVVYLAEDLEGKIKLVKIKRPEVVVDLEDDLDFLSELISYIQPFLKMANVQIPDNLVEMVRTQLLEELDFEKEKRDQIELEGILALRAGKAKHNVKVPKGYEIYDNMVFVEEFKEGVLLENAEQAEKKGYNLAKVKRVLKHELLTQVFLDGEEGVYHLDPHAGNVILGHDGDIVLIDNSLGRLSSKLRMPLLAFLMHLYPRSSSKLIVKMLGWDLLKTITMLHQGAPLPLDALSALIKDIQVQSIDIGDASIGKRIMSAFMLMEKYGVVLDKDIASIKKFFSAADYLLSDIDIFDVPFLYKLVRQVRSQYQEDAAMSSHVEGGINLGELKLDVNDSDIKLNLDPAMLSQILKASGFVPVIINIQPITDLRLFLGINVQEPVAVSSS